MTHKSKNQVFQLSHPEHASIDPSQPEPFPGTLLPEMEHSANANKQTN
jgi:hypothetical protein